MAFTYDPTTLAGQVRLMIADTVTPGHVFEDAEIAAFLAMTSDDVSRAAARAYRVMAGSQARLGRRIKVLDIEVDTKGLAAEYRELAKTLEEEDGGGFAIAEMVFEPFGTRERMEKERLRYPD